MNPYEVMGLESDCTTEDVSRAYRELAKRCHPDVGGDSELFARIALAADILRDPYKRKMYDENGVILGYSQDVIREQIMRKFQELIVAWIESQIESGRDTNIEKFFALQLAQGLRAVNGMIEKSEMVVKRIKARKDSVCCSSTDNFVLEVLQAKIDSEITIIGKYKQELFILKQVQQETKRYSSKETEHEQSFSFGGPFSNSAFNEEELMKMFKGAFRTTGA